MSWSFLPGLVAEFLEECSLDTNQSVLSNTTPTPDQYYWPDKPTEHSRLSRFGTTCVPFEGSRGAELLTWYLAGFPARTSASPEMELESTAQEADSGEKWPGSLAKYDRATCSWKTAQRSLLGDLEPCSVTWPRSGLMLDGQCWELPTLERRTEGSESGYWPTPNTVGYRSDGELKMLSCKLSNRTEYVLMTDRACRSKRDRYWPTPTASAYKGWSPNHNRANTDDRLDYSVEREAFQPGQQTPPMRLNPEWVEWLMGVPIGHTGLKPLETGKYQEWLRQHSPRSRDREKAA